VALREVFEPTLKYAGWYPLSVPEAYYGTGFLHETVEIASFSSYPSGVSTNSASWSLTVPTGANLVVVEVATGPNGAQTTTGVTWNGTALTKWDTVLSSANASNRRAEVWYLTSPTAATGNVVVTNSGVIPTAATAVSFYKASATTPLATAIKNAATTGTSDTLTPTLVPGALFLGIESARSTTGATRAVTQLDLASYICGTSSNMSYVCSWRYTDQNLSWSWAASDEHAAIGVAILPAATANNYNQALSSILEFNQAIRTKDRTAEYDLAHEGGVGWTGAIIGLTALTAFDQSTAQVDTGTYSYQLTWPAASAGNSGAAVITNIPPDILDNGVYLVTARVRSNTTKRVQLADLFGALFISAAPGLSATTSGTANTWETIGCYITPTGGLGFTGGGAFLGFINADATTGGELTWVDNVSMRRLLETQVSKKQTAALSFTGSDAFRTAKTLAAAALSFTGSTAKRTARALAASLAFVGAFLRLPGRALAGALSFTGSQTRRAGKAVAGVLSFTGAQARRTAKTVAGVLSFTGSFASSRFFSRSLSGALSFNSIAYNAAVLALAPKFFYKMDEPSGTTMTDSGSLGTNGTYQSGPTLGQAAIYSGGGGAVRFPSSSGTYATVATSAPASWTALTFAGWWKCTDNAADPFLCGLGWASGSSIPLWVGHASGGGSSVFTAGMFDGGAWRVATGTTTITTGQTYFVAGTINNLTGVSSFVTLYVQGASEGTVGATPASAWTQSTIYLNHQWDTSATTDGTQAGWALWDRALSSTEIANLYAAGTSGLSGGTPLVRQTQKRTSAALSFAGAVARSVSKAVAGALSFTGAVAKRTARALAATLTFTGAVLRAFPKALSAALSFTGAQARRTGKSVAATLTFTGSQARRTAKTTTAVLSFAGVVAKQSSRVFAAALSFAGAVATSFISGSHAFSQTLTAALSFTGSQVKQTTRPLAGALSFTGSVVRRTAKAVSGALSSTGALARSAAKAMTAALSFTGSVTRNVAKLLTGALSFTGSVVRRVARSLSGALSFTGNLLSGLALTRALSGALSFTGSQVRRTGKTASGALSFAGSAALRTGKGVAGALTFTGSQVRSVGRTMTAALSFTGSQVRRVARSVAGALSFAGSVAAKQTGKGLAAALSFTGSQTRSVGKAMAAVLSFIGTINQGAQALQRAFTASLSFTGSQVRRTSKTMTAALSFTGSIARRIPATLAATLTFTGSTARRTARAFTATLTSTGTFTAVKTFFRSLSGALTFTGSQTRAVRTRLAASLGLAGAFALRRTAFVLSAALTFTGTQARRTSKALAGALSFTGSFLRAFPRAFTAALSFTGAQTRRTGKGLSAAVGFTGNLARRFPVALAAALSFAGSIARRLPARALSATLTFTGATTKATSRALSASLGLAGTITRRTGKALSAALLFAGSFARRFPYQLSAALSFTGTFGRRFPVLLASSLSFAGSVATRTLATFVAFAGRITTALGGGRSRASGKGETTAAREDLPTTSARGPQGRSRARKP